MSKISELSDGGNIQDGDTLIAVRSGGNVKVTYDTDNVTFGTVTADGLTVEAVENAQIRVSDGTNPNQRLDIVTNAGASKLVAGNNGAFGLLDFKAFNGTSEITRLQIKNNGDISFYEDTGTTAKVFWDASAERFGIGTSSPLEALHVAGNGYVRNTTDTSFYISSGNTTGTASLYFGDSASLFRGKVQYDNSTETLSLSSNGITPDDVVINSSGNVGIGTSSPTTALDVAGTARALALSATFNTNGPAVVEAVNANTGDSASAQLKLNANGNNFFLTNYGDGTSTPNLTEFLSTAGASQFAFSPNNTEAMRLDSSGDLLLGGTSKTSATSLDRGVYLQSQTDGDVLGYNLFSGEGTNNRRAAFFLDDTNGVYGLDATANTGIPNFVVRTAGTERARITSSGSLLVGKTSTSTVGSGAVISSDGNIFTRTDNTPLIVRRDGTDGVAIQFSKDGTGVGSISVTTTATAYNTSSDVRLKENITDAPAGTVDALQVRSFDWKADGSHQEYGFVAQELEPVAPYAVTKGETEDDMWAVDYSKLVPMLVKEIQDLKARIATLEAN